MVSCLEVRLLFTSDDLTNWDAIGSPRTTGEIINLNSNTSFLEIGGHSDGQSLEIHF